MTDLPLKRPHFKRPPIFEQAIAVGLERMREYESVDAGLFWPEISRQFPISETAPRLPTSIETFEGVEAQMMLSAFSGVQLPRTVFKAEEGGELVQLQDDKFVFNWVRPSEDAQYPRFERTSERFWEIYQRWAEFYHERHGRFPKLKQCELTNVNVIPVASFGADFDHMHRAFKVDPFEWNVQGLVAETYIRQRVHRIVGAGDQPLGRLHSVISPAYGPAGEKVFHFELTARSAPNINNAEDARNFFEQAHMMINGAFLASVTEHMRDMWGEYDNGE